MVLLAGGFSFRKIDDFYVCGLADPKNPLFKDLADTEVIFFENFTAESARALLPAVFLPYVQFDVARNTATVIGPQNLVDRIKSVLLQMDAPRAQVKVRVLVTDVSTDLVKQWGLDLANFNISAGQTVNSAWQAALSLATGSIGLTTDIFGQIVATMRALERESKAKVHADPVLMVTDGKTGELFVGDKRDVATGMKDTNGNPIKQTVESGVTLKVTPRIVGKNIQVDIVQKVSDYIELSSTSAPVLRTAEVTSSLMLVPGQSALAGSLTRQTDVSGYSKVPLLGNIPLLRFLFKQDSSRLTNSELLVFVSAEVVR